MANSDFPWSVGFVSPNARPHRESNARTHVKGTFIVDLLVKGSGLNLKHFDGVNFAPPMTVLLIVPADAIDGYLAPDGRALTGQLWDALGDDAVSPIHRRHLRVVTKADVRVAVRLLGNIGHKALNVHVRL